MAKLYEITNQMAAVLVVIDDAEIDGEIPPELDAALDAIGDSLESKLIGCCQLLRTMEADAAVRRAEAEQFAAEAKRLTIGAIHRENAAARFKAYMKRCLSSAGIKKIDAGLWKLRVQANSQPAVTCDLDPATLDPAWHRVQIELDREKIVAAWKVTGDLGLPDGVKVECGEHLRIS